MGTEEAAPGGRLPNLDVLRGLAAMGVLVSHAYGLGGRAVPLAAGSLTDAALMLLPLGVWLFFAMSGLLIGAPFVRSLVTGTPRPETSAYALRRIARVYPLYLVCAAAVLVAVGVRSMSTRDTAAHLLLLHNLVPDRQLAFINVTWTLSLEVLFYASVPIVAWTVAALRRGRPVAPPVLARWIVATAALSVAWMLAAGFVSPVRTRVGLYARMLFPSMWSAFCPGLLIAVARHAAPADLERSAALRLLDRLRRDPAAARRVGLGFAALGVASFAARPAWGFLFLWAYDLGRVCWSVAFGVLVLRAIEAHHLPARTPRLLERLGDWSYGTYLIHGAVFTVLTTTARGRDLIPLPHGGLAAFAVHALYLTALTLPLAALSWRWIEQPAMRAARRRTTATPEPSPATT